MGTLPYFAIRRLYFGYKLTRYGGVSRFLIWTLAWGEKVTFVFWGVVLLRVMLPILDWLFLWKWLRSTYSVQYSRLRHHGSLYRPSSAQCPTS